jgi:hypothetical protein
MIGAIGTALAVLALPSVTEAQDVRAGPAGFRGGFLGTVLNRSNNQGGRLGGGTNYALLDNPAVQEDLTVTKAQKEEIKKVFERLSRQRAEMFSRLNAMRQNREDPGGQPDQGRQQEAGAQPAAVPSMLEILETTQAEADALFASILKKSQRERLLQIELRRQGPLAVLRPDIAEKLNLNPVQQEQLEMLMSEVREEVQQFLQGRRQAVQSLTTPDGRLDQKAIRARSESRQGKAEITQMRQRGAQIEDQTIKEIGKILTKKQRARFDALLGKPFDLAKLDGADRRAGSGGTGAASGESETSKSRTDRAGPEQDRQGSQEPITAKEGFLTLPDVPPSVCYISGRHCQR